jgi:hypothetical protein
MNKELSYCQYQRFIRKRAFSKFSSKHGLVGIIISVIVPIIPSILWWYASRNGLESLLIALSVLGIFFIIYAIFYLGFYHREQVSTFNSQAKEIQNFFPETLNIKIFNSRLNRYPDENGNFFPNIFIQVHNNNQKKKIVELEGQIVNLVHICLNPKTKKVESLPFSLNTRGLWDKKDIQISLMPEKDAFLCISTFDLGKLVFGEMKFSISEEFEKESVYGLSLNFVGRFDGETDYRRNRYDTVIYAFPEEDILLSGDDALSHCENMSNTLRKVIEKSRSYLNTET